MNTDWLSKLGDWFSLKPKTGAYFICFPAYRPDLVRDVANQLALTFVDYRDTYMAPLKWDASRLTLQDLNNTLANLVQADRGIVVHNVEALLSLKPSSERQQWLAEIAERQFPVPVLIPLMLYTHEMPSGGASLAYVLEPQDLPPESLLERLTSIAQ